MKTAIESLETWIPPLALPPASQGPFTLLTQVEGVLPRISKAPAQSWAAVISVGVELGKEP